jgi:hypothetical protein
MILVAYTFEMVISPLIKTLKSCPCLRVSSIILILIDGFWQLHIQYIHVQYTQVVHVHTCMYMYMYVCTLIAIYIQATDIYHNSLHEGGQGRRGERDRVPSLSLRQLALPVA